MDGKIIFVKKLMEIFLMFFIPVSILSGCNNDIMEKGVQNSDVTIQEPYYVSVIPSATADVHMTNFFKAETMSPIATATSSVTFTASATLKPTKSATTKATQTVTPKPTATANATSKPTKSATTKATQTVTPKPTTSEKPVVSVHPTPVPSVDKEKFSKADYVHISFDDVIVSFQNITSKNYNSLWDEPFFGWLKELHDVYGVKFSLYTYNDVLKNVDERYASQFDSAKDWLKIGFHSTVRGKYLSEATYSDGLDYWNEFVKNVVRITGSLDSIDRIPRLEGFAGSLDVLKGMHDAEYGALGFLSSDDSRKSYYFDEGVAEFLYDNDYIIDRTNNLIFISTDFRAEWCEYDYNNYVYKKPTESSVYRELAKREESNDFVPVWKSLIFFSHEYLIYNGGVISNKRASFIEDMCKFTLDYNLIFDYPQNRVYLESDNDFLFN